MERFAYASINVRLDLEAFCIQPGRARSHPALHQAARPPSALVAVHALKTPFSATPTTANWPFAPSRGAP